MASQTRKKTSTKKAEGNKSILTDKQWRFVYAYLVSSNPTEAARVAGASRGSASVTANRMLRNVKVLREIKKLQDERAKRLTVKADDVLDQLLAIGFTDIGDLLEYKNDELKLKPSTEVDTRAIKSVKLTETANKYGVNKKVEVSLYDKVEALREADKHLGIVDQHEVKHEVNVVHFGDKPKRDKPKRKKK